MKKLMTLGIAAIAAGAVFAAANDVVVTFSTPGPDTYADGTTVVDGEKYALCWSQDFSQFAIKSDGTAEGGVVVLKAPVAKGGRCPTVVFEVDAAYAAANFDGGEWAVYLLDTRDFGNGAVNTSGCVGKASVGTGTLGSLSGVAAATSEVAGGIDVPQPKVTGIKVVDGFVYVTVQGTVPFLAYGLTEGATPDAITSPVEGSKAGSADKEIVLVTPAKEGGAFFKVGRK